MVNADGIPIEHIESFGRTVEAMVQNGTVFSVGETLLYGWMYTLVQRLTDNTLTLHEPDMRSMPIRFVPGVTETIRHTMLQLFALDSFGVDRSEMDVPTIRHSAIVCSRFGEGAGLIMDRSVPSDGADSGWFVGCANDDCDHNDVKNLRRISLYEVYLARPEIVYWVAFPCNTAVLRTDDCAPQVFRDGAPVALIPGSFMDELWKGR